MVLVQGGGGGVPAAAPNKKPRDYHEARGSGAGPSRACCRKPLMNSRSSTAMPSSDAASSGAPDDASSAESESDTDTVDTAARAGGRARARSPAARGAAAPARRSSQTIPLLGVENRVNTAGSVV